MPLEALYPCTLFQLSDIMKDSNSENRYGLRDSPVSPPFPSVVYLFVCLFVLSSVLPPCHQYQPSLITEAAQVRQCNKTVAALQLCSIFSGPLSPGTDYIYLRVASAFWARLGSLSIQEPLGDNLLVP